MCACASVLANDAIASYAWNCPIDATLVCLYLFRGKNRREVKYNISSGKKYIRRRTHIYIYIHIYITGPIRCANRQTVKPSNSRVVLIPSSFVKNFVISGFPFRNPSRQKFLENELQRHDWMKSLGCSPTRHISFSLSGSWGRFSLVADPLRWG